MVKAPRMDAPDLFLKQVCEMLPQGNKPFQEAVEAEWSVPIREEGLGILRESCVFFFFSLKSKV